MGAVLCLVLAQTPPLEAERERLKGQAPLTESQKKAYSLPAAPPAKPRASYTLAVVPLSFADRAVADADPGRLFFGPVADYFTKSSGGQFKLSGKTLAGVTLSVERSKFRDADLAKVAVLEGFDGVAFVVAGPLGSRGTPLWPHKETLQSGNRTIDYILVPEEAGDRAAGIAAHETMHLLGFSDKYDDEKAAVGRWCILGTGYATKEPAPPCAECREKLGWTAPSEIDPRKPAAVVLPADPARSARIPLNADGTESLLLEMRDRLFVWHVGGGRKIELVGRFPSENSDRVTPLSDPPFRGRTLGAREVWLTDIRLQDGQAWFRVGPAAPLTPLEEWRRANVGKRLGD